jgi:hypothetical protein
MHHLRKYDHVREDTFLAWRGRNPVLPRCGARWNLVLTTLVSPGIPAALGRCRPRSNSMERSTDDAKAIFEAAYKAFLQREPTFIVGDSLQAH